MADENPFSKNSRITRTPPPSPQHKETPAIENHADDYSMEAESDGSESQLPKKDNIIQVLLNTDISAVQADTMLDADLRSYITHSKDALEFLVEENQNFQALLRDQENKYLQSQAENKKIIEQLQAQVKSVISSPSTSGANQATKMQKTAQTKLNFKQRNVASSKTEKKSAVLDKNSFSALAKDVESENNESTLESEGDTEEEVNSDPEFKTIREKARKTSKLKKRKKTKDSHATENDKKTIISTDDSTSQKDRDKAKKPRPPPPIKIVGKTDYKYLRTVLKSGSNDEQFSIKYINEDSCRINPLTEEAFRGITSALKEEKASNPNLQFYTHENKNSRNIKVLCRGLDPDTPVHEIIDFLKDKEIRILNATCLLKKIPVDAEGGEKHRNEITPESSGATKDSEKTVPSKKVIREMKSVKLPLFQLEFEPAEDIDKIYAIKSILNQIVKIEPLKKLNDTIVQCRRCQNFGHTLNYCEKNPKCVKCAGKHLTSDCKFAKKIINPKCINCGAIGHPASYRGCPFAKEFSLARKQALKKRGKETPLVKGSFPPLKSKNSTIAKPPKKLDKSFTEALTGEKPKKSGKPISSDNSDLINILVQTIAAQSEQLKVLTEKLTRLEAQLSATSSNLVRSK